MNFIPYILEQSDGGERGYDIYSRQNIIIPDFGSGVFDTGVHVEIPRGYVGFLKSKSGLNVKHSITGEGVIDSGYTGSICVKLYNDSRIPYSVKKGDKLIQLVILPIITPELCIVDSIDGGERGDRGFGSTGF
jgi:dUTP pyrophosphatase